MKLWLDDIRPAPEGWIWCKSVNEAKECITLEESIEERAVELISLDHDLGIFADHGGDGIALMDWLVERCDFIPVEFHTMNPVGRENMVRMYRRYWLGESL